MAEVPRKATPVTQAEVVRLLPGAFAAAGLALTREAAWLFLGLVFLENKRGAGIYNHNWGNLAAGATWAGDLWRPEWYRQVDVDALPAGDRKTRLQGLHDRMGKDVPAAFRAYGSSDEGLRAFASLFKLDRYVPLVSAASAGSAAAFAAAIKLTGYTPDLNVTEQTASYEALQREFARSEYFPELPAKPTLPSTAAPAAPLELIPGRGYVPMAFEALAAGALHVAKPRCRFLIRELQAFNALGNAVVLDVRAKIRGVSYTCIPSDDPIQARVFVEARRFELPGLSPGDELAIYVAGTVSAFVAWGEIQS